MNFLNIAKQKVPRSVVDAYRQICRWRTVRVLKWFDENYYLGRYPEVKKAVSEGQFACGLEHFLSWGQSKKPRTYHPFHWVLSPLRNPGEIPRALRHAYRIGLEKFLSSQEIIEIPSCRDPQLSVVFVLAGGAEFALNSLRIILRSCPPSFQLVLVDSGMAEEVRRLRERVHGAKLVQATPGETLFGSVNRALQLAEGPYLLLLNQGAQIFSGSIRSALEVIQSSDEIGCVGGRILRSNTVLQEAGGIISREGECSPDGFLSFSFQPAYMYERDVDYCSSGFLLTRRDLFLKLGGFCEDYHSEPYPEADYCARLWKLEKRVVYHPQAMVLQGPRSREDGWGVRAQDRAIFYERHRDLLKNKKRIKILYLDDKIPHHFLGAGSPRGNRILWEMVKMGYFVTFYPMLTPKENWEEIYRDIPRGLEVMADQGVGRLRKFLNERGKDYHLMFVSRPHNMKVLRLILSQLRWDSPRPKVIYDAEAIFALKEIGCRQIRGEKFSSQEIQKILSDELSAAQGCDGVISVSDREAERFVQHGMKKVYTLSYGVSTQPLVNDRASRADILFVGPIHNFSSPNADSVLWFSESVFPIILRLLGEPVRFMIAGSATPGQKKRFSSPGVEVLGNIQDLTGLYRRARIFVAPTRFAAGIPIKVLEAVGFGLPVVATSLIRDQLGWQDGVELLVADDPQAFAHQCVRLYREEVLWESIRQNALQKVRKDFSLNVFSSRLRHVFEEVLKGEG